jgi:hypothetical protein
VRDELLGGVALVRRTAGDQRVNGRAKGVHVGRGRRRLSAEHLRRGVGEGAGEEPGHRFVSTGDARGPEVAQLRLAVIVNERIPGLDIAMQCASPMRGFQRPAQLHSDAQCLGPRDPALPAYSLCEGTRCVVRHHDEWPVAFGYADMKDVDDVRVAGQPTHRVALTQKPFPVIFVEISREHLDGDASPERLLVAAVDNPTPAPANFDGVLEPGGCQLRRYPARHSASSSGEKTNLLLSNYRAKTSQTLELHFIAACEFDRAGNGRSASSGIEPRRPWAVRIAELAALMRI